MIKNTNYNRNDGSGKDMYLMNVNGLSVEMAAQMQKQLVEHEMRIQINNDRVQELVDKKLITQSTFFWVIGGLTGAWLFFSGILFNEMASLSRNVSFIAGQLQSAEITKD